MTKINYHILGIMSGTSCDGIDIAHCSFYLKNKKWNFKIHQAKTFPYSPKMEKKLKKAHAQPSYKLLKLDAKLGNLIGKSATSFLLKFGIKSSKIDFIASHGHTIFHNPQKGYTLQIGNGNNIKSKTGITTIYDFRTMDISLGGQGAPLVPIGDELLFNKYDYCINIGGIANTSFSFSGNREAFDICFANMALNDLCNKINLPFDFNGNIAKKHTVNSNLLTDLMATHFKKQSLSTEIYLKSIKPILNSHKDSVENKIATVTEYLAQKISNTISENTKVLITGGGAYNDHLILRLKTLNPTSKITIPNTQLIEFKEALIFAFLGVLKFNNIPNCLASVTGAKRDNVGGVIV